jgi:ribonuclease HI
MGLDITYVSQTAIKSQALVDFIAEWTETQQPHPPVAQEHWSMYLDCSFTLNSTRGGIVLISPQGDRLLDLILLHFCATKNMAEYEALVNGLYITAKIGVQWLYICRDSELISNQVLGESSCRGSCMAANWPEVRRLEEKLDYFKLHHILRQDNEVADALSSFGSIREPPPLCVFTQDLIKPSIRIKEDIPEPMPGTSSDASDSIPTPGALPREDGPIPTSEANPGPSAGLIKPSLGPAGE